MYTSVVLLALTGGVSPADRVTAPDWNRDYGQAWKLGQSEKKPLAVFVGNGPGGWDNVSKEGKLGGEVNLLLKSYYVCVYVDASDPAGRRLSASFEMADRTGLVLSDGKGDRQAFRHVGDLANRDLEHYLRKYSDPSRVVLTTETVAREETRYVSQAAPAPASPPPTFSNFVPASFSGPAVGGRQC